MRTLQKILAVTLLTNLIPFAYGQAVEGTMSCIIQDTSLQQIQDGKAESFKGYKGGLEKGDSFSLSYSFLNNTISKNLFKLDTNRGDRKKDMNFLFSESFSFSKSNTNRVTDLVVTDGKNRRVQVIYRPIKKAFIHSYMHLRENSITLGLAGSTQLDMRRYYKGDWMGMYTYATSLVASPITSLSYSFDCKHSSEDNWLEVFEALLKVPR